MRKEAVVGTGADAIDRDDILGIYLAEVDHYPRIKPEEEAVLLTAVIKGRKALRVKSTLPASSRRHIRLEEIVSASKKARITLAQANLSLVLSRVFRIARERSISINDPLILDLISGGNIGLMKAIDKYDPAKAAGGKRLSTYAYYWIDREIWVVLQNGNDSMPITHYARSILGEMATTEQNLLQELGNTPNLLDILARMRTAHPAISVRSVAPMIRASQPPPSIDLPVWEGEDSDLHDTIPDNMFPDPAQEAEDENLRQIADELLASLTPREARILMMRCGYGGGYAYTLEEIGKKFGLSRTRIQQIEAKALGRLRHPSRVRRLRDYLE